MATVTLTTCTEARFADLSLGLNLATYSWLATKHYHYTAQDIARMLRSGELAFSQVRSGETLDEVCAEEPEDDEAH